MKINYFGKIIQYVYDHIDQPLCLADIAEHVNLSLSSLKRLFEDVTDQTPGKFIRRLKLELAFCSLQSKNIAILEIALSSGFNDHAAFSRCFKSAFGYAPREARKQLTIVSKLKHINLGEPDSVELVNFKCQAITKVGTYFDAAPEAFRILKQTLQDEELSDDFPGFFIGIGHDNPHEQHIAINQVRFTAGVTTITRSLGLEIMDIAAGCYARFRYYGKPSNLGLAYHYIYSQWIESSAYVIDKKRITFQVFEKLPSGLHNERVIINVPVLMLSDTNKDAK